MSNRRAYIDKLTPAERAIRDAMVAVEAIPGGHVLLTEAISLLQRAKDKVGDYVDQQRDAGNAETEFAWVIERGDSSPSAPTYWTGPSGLSGDDGGWSQDHMDAIRFAREEDARQVMCRFRYPNCRACEHGWIVRALSPQEGA